jgi:hypothetical protein
MDQNMLNWVFAAFGAIISWILNAVWGAIKDLKTDMKEINKEIHEDFLRKDDYRVDIADMKQMLNRIFEKLDSKVDKS